MPAVWRELVSNVLEMRRSAARRFAACASVCALVVATGSAQNKADFSGYWILESPRAADAHTPAVLGVRQVMRIDTARTAPPILEQLAVERRFPQRIVWSSHRITAPGQSLEPGGDTQFWSGQWARDRLILDSRSHDHDSGSVVDFVERHEEWRLSAGRLYVTSSIGGTRVQARKIAARYRRFVPPALDDTEVYAVYASLLTDNWLGATGNARLIIQRETTPYNECLPMRSALEGDWLQVLDNYAAMNAMPRAIQPGRNLPRPYTVLAQADIHRGFDAPYGAPQGDGWSALRERYPDSRGYLWFSAVGFNATKTRALVYLAYQCGGLCGAGAHQLLEKVDGRWQPAQLPKAAMCSWIS